jgi:arginyl-tRNA synthetase
MESKVAKNTSNCCSVSVSWLGKFAAIKQMLQQHLFAALSLSAMGIATAELPSSAKLTPEAIPVHRLSDDTCVVYRSAIALKLAPLWQLPPLDIANQLTASFLTTSQDNATQRCLDFSVEVVFPGWINFRLSDRGLASWLQQLIQISPCWEEGELGRGEAGERGRKSNKGALDRLHITYQGQLDERPKNAHNLFPVQYAHARCCSLLRLAHTEGLIKLRDLDFKTLSWQLVEPNPIPWLNDDQREETRQVLLRLVHPAERRLIAQLLNLQDEISDQGQLSGVKLATTLSNAFEKFYSSCRIWGEVKTQTPKLAQARLGLVGVTQGLLRSLLQDQLGVSAPVEL